MKKFFNIIYILFSLTLLFYLVLPNPDFPSPPPDAIQSKEPADTETSLRRAYFTNYTREEILGHYKNQLSKSSVLSLPVRLDSAERAGKAGFQLWLPTYRLNYPPEEAQTIIRDQTRSTFLEEIVHPFRESIFVNGFEPKDPKDAIFIEGKSWRQKIIVRYVSGGLLARILVGVATLSLTWLLIREWFLSITTFKKT